MGTMCIRGKALCATLRMFAPRISSAHVIHGVARATSYVRRTSCISSARTESKLNDDLCGNLICEYFCWMLGDPHFFFGRSLPFLILSIILKNKENLYVGSFNYFSYTIQIGSTWYMDTGVRDLQVACFKANST